MRVVLGYLREYVFDEARVLESDMASVIRRIEKVFANRRYLRMLASPKNAWMDEPVETVTNGILNYLKTLI